jgi:ABC-type nickel/cobalt efflux system permease component RcnA
VLQVPPITVVLVARVLVTQLTEPQQPAQAAAAAASMSIGLLLVLVVLVAAALAVRVLLARQEPQTLVAVAVAVAVLTVAACVMVALAVRVLSLFGTQSDVCCSQRPAPHGINTPVCDPFSKSGHSC